MTPAGDSRVAWQTVAAGLGGALAWALAARRRDAQKAQETRRRLQQDLAEQTAALAVAATTDTITGLGNTRALERRTAELLVNRRPESAVSVAVIDIDYFEPFNRVGGRLLGDDCLRKVAAVIGSVVSHTDTVVRFGDDAFLIVLPDADGDRVRGLASRIHDRLRNAAIPHPESPVSERVTVTVGAVTCGAGAHATAEMLIAAAEEALDEAKNAGRNRTFHRHLHAKRLTERGSIRLGLLAPFTGVVSMYGEEIARAARLAVEQVNEAGGIRGRRLELIVLDDGSQPDTAVAAARHLVSEEGCAALIGTLLSNSRIAVTEQVAHPWPVPLLSFSFYEGSIADRWFFNYAAVPNQQIETLVPYLLGRFGSSFYFAGNNYEWPRGSIDAAKRALLARGGRMVGEDYLPFSPDADRIAELIDDIATSGANVVVPYFAGLDQVAFLRAFHNAGLGDIIGVGMGHFDAVLAGLLAPDERDGLVVANSYFMTVDTPENADLLRRLAATPGVSELWPPGNGTLTNFGEGAWVCVQAFADAARRVVDDSPEALAEALASGSVRAPQGTVTMDRESQHAAVNCYIAECRADGRLDVVASAGAVPARLPQRFTANDVAGDTDSGAMLAAFGPVDGAAVLVSEDGRLLAVNPPAATMFGYQSDELVGLDLHTLVPPHQRSIHMRHVASVVEGKLPADHRVRRDGVFGYRKDGTFFDLGVTLSRHELNGQLVLMGVLTDLSEWVASHARRSKEIGRDALTGLPGGTVFAEQLRSALDHADRQGQRLLVATVDVDGLDAINRRWGTATGDHVLTSVAAQLTRIGGAIAARLSDDRFAVATTADMSVSSKSDLAETITAAGRATVDTPRGDFVATATVGLAMSEPGRAAAADLIRQSEAALYDAKSSDRGGWRFYSPEQQAQAERRLAIDAMLRAAAVESQVRFVLQPIVALDSLDVIGAEALLRWHSPLGPVGPGEFIPVAETNGAILRLGRWVVDNGVELAGRMPAREDGRPFLLSLNLSPQQLPQAANQLARALETTGLDPSQLLVEITETGLDLSDPATHTDLEAIEALDVHLAIDDFGTGTSGLAAMSRIGVGWIKIDRSFVHGAAESPRRSRLLEAIVSMAHALDQQVIAEGVERHEDLALLRRLSCEAVQGYLLARPIEVAEFERLWLAGRIPMLVEN